MDTRTHQLLTAIAHVTEALVEHFFAVPSHTNWAHHLHFHLHLTISTRKVTS